MNALSVKGLNYSYSKKEKLFENLSFELSEGKILCVLGPNGSGKTTLIKQILFPDGKNADKVELFGKKSSTLSTADKSKLIGYVPQKIIPVNISVIQAVVMGRLPYKNILKSKPSAVDYDEAHEALKQMGIDHVADKQLGEISGGEAQKVFIAQSIVKKADIYFFDEPMSALDPEYQSGFLSMIKWLSESGKTVVFSTHNPNHLFSLPDAEVALVDRFHKLHRYEKVSQEMFGKIESIYNNRIIVKKDADGELCAVFI